MDKKDRERIYGSKRTIVPKQFDVDLPAIIQRAFAEYEPEKSKRNGVTVQFVKDVWDVREDTAIRIQETLDLCVRDFYKKSYMDTETREKRTGYFIYVVRSKTKGRGVDSSEILIEAPAILEILNRYTKGKKPDEFIFSWAGNHVKTQNLRHIWEKVRVKAVKIAEEEKKTHLVKILEKFHQYYAKGICITRWQREGVSGSLLKVMAGWTPKSNMEGYYSGLTTNDTATVRARLHHSHENKKAA